MMNANNALMAGDCIKVVKGCTARNIRKSDLCRVVEVSELGWEYSHQIRVVLAFVAQPRRLHVAMTARHRNRLSDDLINLNDGNPCHKIQVRRAY